jgi:radical SAM protein with 4Fe4S-binding SPASM domain
MSIALIRDTLNLLACIPPRKALNYLKGLPSATISRCLSRPVILSQPSWIHIEPLNFCNLHCPECPTGAGLIPDKKQLPLSDYKIILDQISKSAFYLNLYFRGEPLLHKDFVSMVRLAVEKGLYTLTSTNAQLLNKELAEKLVNSGLHKIIISFDGPGQEVYSSYRRGGDWQKVLDAIGFLRDARREQSRHTPLIVAQCLLMRSNEQRKKEISMLAKSAGADRLEFKTMQILDLQKASSFLPERSGNSRYQRSSEGYYTQKKKKRRTCRRLFNAMVIESSGLAVACCYDKHGQWVWGNLLEQPFNKIWKSPAHRDFIKLLLQNREQITICKNCPE